jgi:uncharacterized protein (DUF2235 family)
MESDQPHICRRLILLLDGTWNEDNDKQPATNIVYLRERLFWGLQVRLREQEAVETEIRRPRPESQRIKAISGIELDGFEYIVYYDRGVGTGPFLDPIKGGVTGEGLDRNIRKAYKFLSLWFRPGDEIFVFGFSRGAFTARSLCGYLQAVGLLRRECCDKENEERAWDFYRTPPADRLSADWLTFRQTDAGTGLVHNDNEMRVRALVVFDTVGALGIPIEGFRRFNRSKYEFHDTDVGSLVDIRLHAVALDEPRWAFEPTLWTKPKFKVVDARRSPTEQVWFVGAHSDIGGGYVKWNQDEKGLSHLSLSWMLQRLEYHLINTPPLAPEIKFEVAVKPQRGAPIPFYVTDLLSHDTQGHSALTENVKQLSVSKKHRPWALARFVRPDASRVINQITPQRLKKIEAKGMVPHADPIGEMIHVSALHRISSDKSMSSGLSSLQRLATRLHLFDPRYRPRNLTGVIPYIAATYLDRHFSDQKKNPIETPWKKAVVQIFPWKHIRIVDWNGEPLDPSVDADVARAFQLLPGPEAIGVREVPREMKLVQR